MEVLSQINRSYEEYLHLNFSTLRPTVGTMFRTLSSSDFKWLTMVDLPLLFKPRIRILTSFFFIPKILANFPNSFISTDSMEQPALRRLARCSK